jgi:hypothetical protein
MTMEPDEQDKQALEAIWRAQARPEGPPLDFTSPALGQGRRPATAAEVARDLAGLLAWPEWVLLFPKASQAVVALNRLLKAQGRPGGVLWVAPGTGAPYEPPRGEPGLAMLRADWAPDQGSPALSQEKIRAQGLYLVVDEGTTGLRLARGGAVEHFGLTPDAALYGPALAGGLEFAALAGRGPAPALPKQEPTPESLAAAAATLDLARQTDIPARLAAWGRALALGLEWFAARAGVGDKISWEGPLALPRLKGKRLWAFLELCREEGLALSPLVLFDPGLDPALAPELLWTRLCRAAIRLKALPEGDKAPHGWSEAQAVGFCSRSGDILDLDSL